MCVSVDLFHLQLPVDSISTAEPRQSSSGDGNSDAEDTGFEDEDVTLNDPFEVS